jgi:hypothetical protein
MATESNNSLAASSCDQRERCSEAAPLMTSSRAMASGPNPPTGDLVFRAVSLRVHRWNFRKSEQCVEHNRHANQAQVAQPSSLLCPRKSQREGLRSTSSSTSVLPPSARSRWPPLSLLLRCVVSPSSFSSRSTCLSLSLPLSLLSLVPFGPHSGESGSILFLRPPCVCISPAHCSCLCACVCQCQRVCLSQIQRPPPPSRSPPVR